MNLVVDSGNTRIKIAVFQTNTILERQDFSKENFLTEYEKILKKYPEIDHSILSSVTNFDLNHLEKLKNDLDLLVLDTETPVPFKNDYDTPKSLGLDRIGLAAAAVNQYPEKNVLVIDAGTCITYDIKTAQEVYLGGAISPGLEMRFRSLHKFTANLPLVSPKPDAQLIGKSTETSILSGIINGIKMELAGVIESYRTEFEDLTVIITGGDSQILSIPLKNSIFANSNFLLEGLNFILEFNKTQ
ncbi:type III pantothenate kinase [Christiangramia aquimixticola]|uniref:type III pantothenate kinase n=1 Tax=Christiangramia aquimixticola TaxID=1697558 RepID=UPI003AA800D9